MRRNIEIALISKVIETGDFQYVKDRQIRKYYMDKEFQPMFEFLEKSHREGQSATPKMFIEKFPNFPLEKLQDGTIGTEENLNYWCNRLRDKVIQNLIADSFDSVGDLLQLENVEGAINQIKKTLANIDVDYTETSAIDVTQDTEDRLALYEKRRETKGMIGIPTGINLLDYILKGVQDKQLITLMAKTGVGKTWVWVLIASKMWLQGKRILFFTTEMSEEQILLRIEAMSIGIKGINFSYNDLRSGTLDHVSKKAYEDFQEEKKRREKFIIETATDVTSIASKIELYKPDVVFVDSTYLMEDDQKSDADWLRVANIFRGLKKLAKRTEVPILANTQQDVKSGSANLGAINFARSITHESDVVLALERDEEMLEENEAKIKILKQREGTLGNVHINWDFKRMHFEGIFSTNENGEPLDREGVDKPPIMKIDR